MYFTNTHHQIALTLLSGVGSKRARAIIAHFESLEEFFVEKKLNLAKLPGISPHYLSVEHRLKALIESDKILTSVEKKGLKIVFYTDKDYPRRLKQCQDAPLLLYTQGNIEWNPTKIISVVGTRHATTYGKDLTLELIEGLKPHYPTIVSGMAYGIDIFAHQFALKNDLPTWGVLGHGIGQMYPSEHKKFVAKMLEKGGLISEFVPNLKADPAYFPMRNRIVAGLSDATIVIESGDKGGSLITADLAAGYNRDVFAYPGDVTKPYSKGCLKLIQNNKAMLLTSSVDLIQALNWHVDSDKRPAQRSLFVELNPVEQKIIDALKSHSELSLDSICFLASMSVSQASTLLLGLEFKGMIRALPGRRFQII